MQHGSPSESSEHLGESSAPTHPADSLTLSDEDDTHSPIAVTTGQPGPHGPSEGQENIPTESDSADLDEHEIKRKKTKREIVEELKEKTKKARWNVFLFLGIGAILFTFALFPMSTPGFWEGSNLKSDPLDAAGQINSPILIYGIPGVEVKVDVEVWVMDKHGGDIEVYLVPGYCDNLELLYTTSDMRDENSPRYALIEDAAPGSVREVELSADPIGAHCFVTWYNNSHVVNPSLEAAVHVYSNRVPAGVLAACSLSMSGFAFFGAQKYGRKMKELLAPASKKTPEEEALEAVQLSRLSAGPGKVPMAGTSGAVPSSAVPPSARPSDAVSPATGPTEVDGEVGTLEEGPAVAGPSDASHPASSAPPGQPSLVADAPMEAEPDYVATGDGYFYLRNADGSFQPQAYYQGPDGRYWPYEG